MERKREKTAEGSDPKAGDAGGIVPASPSSSSSDGPPMVLPSGAMGEWVTEWLEEGDKEREFLCVLPFVPSKRAGAIIEGLYSPEPDWSQRQLGRLRERKERVRRYYDSARLRYLKEFRRLFESEFAERERGMQAALPPVPGESDGGDRPPSDKSPLGLVDAEWPKKISALQQENRDLRESLDSLRSKLEEALGTVKSLESRVRGLERVNPSQASRVPVGGEGDVVLLSPKSKKRRRIRDGALPSFPTAPHIDGVGAITPTKAIVPPSGDPSWATVVGRKRKKKGSQEGAKPPPPPPRPSDKGGKKKVVVAPPTAPQGATREPPSKGVSVSSARRRLPRTEAVIITVENGDGASYAEVIRRAREAVVLEELGITATRLRRARTGGLLVEIPGKEAAPKADAFARRLEGLFRGEAGVRVSRPSQRLDLRVEGFDDSVTSAEVASAIAAIGGCVAEDIRVGRISRGPGGMYSVWVQGPARAAVKAAGAAKVGLGWASARVVLLQSRPLRCFRCLALGHVQQRCPASCDRAHCCYNCGEEGHTQADCANQAHCPACAERGLRASHRPGGRGCAPCPPKPEGGTLGRRGQRGESVASNATEIMPERQNPPPSEIAASPPPRAVVGEIGGGLRPSGPIPPPSSSDFRRGEYSTAMDLDDP